VLDVRNAAHRQISEAAMLPIPRGIDALRVLGERAWTDYSHGAQTGR
jgi:hypothetical protein